MTQAQKLLQFTFGNLTVNELIVVCSALGISTTDVMAKIASPAKKAYMIQTNQSKVAVVKLVRTVTGMGLKEALDLADSKYRGDGVYGPFEFNHDVTANQYDPLQLNVYTADVE